jgi:dCMP deaminase
MFSLVPTAERRPADKWDVRFLDLAKHVRSWSKDPSTKHATVIVRPDRTIAGLGYNGFVRGCPVEEDAVDRPEKYSRVMHGEVNAVLNCHEPVRGYTAYVTSGVACDRCTVFMLQAGIERFVFMNGDDDYWSRWGESATMSIKYINELNKAALIIDDAGNIAWSNR